LSVGNANANRRVVRARALNHVASVAGRKGFIRSRLMRDAETQDYLVEALGGATGAPSHLLAGLSEANAMIRIPEEVTEIRPGDVVDVIFLAQGRCGRGTDPHHVEAIRLGSQPRPPASAAPGLAGIHPPGPPARGR